MSRHGLEPSHFLLLSLLCSLFSLSSASPLTSSHDPNPASSPAPKFLSLALSSPSPNAALAELQSPHTHAYIIHQHHLNHALSRFAHMTNRSGTLTREVLASAMDARIGMLPERYRTPHRGRATQRGDNIPLNTWGQDLGYIATAQLGTPPRDYRLLVDSGSADLWVGAEGCQSDKGGGGCGPHALLGPSTSSTFKFVSNISAFDPTNPPWIVSYVTGDVSGVYVQDDVRIGGVSVRNHAFGAALRESEEFTGDDIPFEGLLGLAKRDVSQQRLPSLLAALYNASLVSAPIAAYRLPRTKDRNMSPHNPTPTPKPEQGELTLGALNPAWYNAHTLVEVQNVNKFGYFGVPIGGVSVAGAWMGVSDGGKGMGWSDRTGLVDSGTVLVVAPQMDVDTVHSHIPGAVKSPADAAPGEQGTWTVPCDMTTRVGISVGGRVFEIDPRDVAMWPVEDDNSGGGAGSSGAGAGAGGTNGGGAGGGSPPKQMCMSGIAPGTVGPFHLDTDWMLGSVFLKNVYFATDEKRDVVLMANLK